MKIILRSVSKDDIRFLYELLKNRSLNVNISHKKMPTYTQHSNFVKAHPYSKWYIIFLGNQKIGSLYLSKINEIGISLKKEFNKKRIKNSVLDILVEKDPRKRYLVNINPKNKNSIEFFIRRDFKLIQYSYELIKEGIDENKSF